MFTGEGAQKEPQRIKYAGLRDYSVSSAAAAAAWPQPNSSYRKETNGPLPLVASNVTQLQQVEFQGIQNRDYFWLFFVSFGASFPFFASADFSCLGPPPFVICNSPV